jgi:hypothetical protein
VDSDVSLRQRSPEQGERLKRQYLDYTKNQRDRRLDEARYWCGMWRWLARDAIEALRAAEALLRKQ